jgi:hypothetical protein
MTEDKSEGGRFYRFLVPVVTVFAIPLSVLAGCNLIQDLEALANRSAVTKGPFRIEDLSGVPWRALQMDLACLVLGLVGLLICARQARR